MDGENLLIIQIGGMELEKRFKFKIINSGLLRNLIAKKIKNDIIKNNNKNFYKIHINVQYLDVILIVLYLYPNYLLM